MSRPSTETPPEQTYLPDDSSGVVIDAGEPSRRSQGGHDKLVESRWTEDDPLRMQQVVPSDAADPVEAQKDYRGWIVVVIVVLIVIGTFEAFAIVSKVTSRRIIYAPEAQRIGAAASSREPSELEIQAMLKVLVSQLESWTPASVGDVWQRMLPYLHPTLHDAMKDTYEKLATQAGYLWMHRAAIPLGVAPGAKTASGLRTYALFYDQIEMTGREEKDRQVSAFAPKAAYIQVIIDNPTSENPLGIVIVTYKTYERAGWLRAGFPDYWDTLRKPKVAGAKK